MLILLIAVLVLLLLYRFLEDIHLFYICNYPPGPPSLPIIGGIHHLALGNIHQNLSKLYDKYGSIFSVRLGPVERIIFIHDEEMLMEILQHKSSANRPNFPYIHNVLNPPDGSEGIGSCPYNKSWKTQTKVLKNCLNYINNNTLTKKLQEKCETFFERIDSEKGLPFNPSKYLHLFTMSLMYNVIYDDDPLDWDDPRVWEMNLRDETLLQGLINIHPLNVFPWLKHLPFSFIKDIYQKRKDLSDFISTVYTKYKTQQSSGHMVHLTEEYIATKLTSDQHETLTQGNMQMSLYAMYTGGKDTLHATLLWVVLLLATKRDVLEKCQKEVDSKDTDKTNSFNTEKTLEDYPYTSAVILEVLRLVSPLTIGIPHSNTTDIHIGSYTIPKDSTIFFNQRAIHHNSEKWPQPLQFKPERFLNEENQLLSKHELQNMSFIIFGKGRRKCIGEDLALIILLQTTCALVKNYDIQIDPSERHYSNLLDYEQRFEIQVYPKDYKIIMNPRRV